MGPLLTAPSRPCELRERTSHGWREAFARGILVLAAVGAALGLAEGAVRLLERADTGRVRETFFTARRATQLYCVDVDKTGYYPIDLNDPATKRRYRDELGIENIPASQMGPSHCVELHFNPQGFRSREPYTPGPAPAGVLRVAVFGDSFVEGIGIRDEDTVTARLQEDLLRRTGRRVEVLNFGVAGFGSRDISQTVRREADRYKPDLVLYIYVLNDPVHGQVLAKEHEALVNDFINFRAIRSRREIGALLGSAGSGPLGGWLARSALVRALLARDLKKRIAGGTVRWYKSLYAPGNRPGWRRTRRHLAEMGRSQRAAGRDFGVAIMPLLVQLDRYPFEDVHRQVSRALGACSIPSLDLLEDFRGEDAGALWVCDLDWHPNAHAQARMARAIARWATDTFALSASRPSGNAAKEDTL